MAFAMTLQTKRGRTPSQANLRGPKYRDILGRLRSEIGAGKFDDNGKLPSESELVERFNVSRPTVARALRELQGEGLIDRRAGSGTFLREKGPRDAGLLGLLVPALGNTEIFDPICAEIAHIAHEANHALLWGGSSDQDMEARVRQAEEVCQRYIRQKVTGVFFAPVELTPQSSHINRRIAEALKEAGIAIVLLDRDLEPFPKRSEFDLVGVDNFAAGYRIASHLIKLGCSRIGFVAKPHSASTVDLRIAGWREAMIRAGLESHSLGAVHIGDPNNDGFIRKLLGSKPEALICANDMTAALVMQRLTQAGKRVPDDIRLVGFDDLKYARLLSVPLTTMHQPCAAIGAAAVETLFERIRNPKLARREILLDTELVVRQSCGGKVQEQAA
jgi:GntR family transcriptional regulator, arabinose operon transcriptional repressor